jgi:hypothetical protein
MKIRSQFDMEFFNITKKLQNTLSSLNVEKLALAE